tara:strand:+ start:56 stop:445 length:390 start_codon:yes stop_codon:yes gene_type:complete
VNEGVNEIKIKEIKHVGDEILSKKISDNLPFTVNKNDEILNQIIIEAKKSKVEASKNSKGQVTSYKAILVVKFKILDNNGNFIDEKLFQDEFYYDTNENKFKLKEYENKIEKNLINNIVEGIIIYLNYL